MSGTRHNTTAILADCLFIFIFLSLIGIAIYLTGILINKGVEVPDSLLPVVGTLTESDSVDLENTEYLSLKGSDDVKLYNIDGRVVVNNRYDTLLVIKGEVMNLSSDHLKGITLTAHLTNTENTVVAEKQFFAGTVISEDELFNVAPPVDQHLNNKTNATAKPGEVIPFMVVFDNLPENLSEFTITPLKAIK